MRLGVDASTHLTYCSNIHPGESWPEVRGSIERYYPAVKARVAPREAFGVGLRLSAIAATALSRPESLQAFKRQLEASDLYVFTINGFPYGPFHGQRVKEDVYLPDWRSEERLAYTDVLADVLASLLPEGISGSISTVPGAFKRAITSSADEQLMAQRLAHHVAHLVSLHERTGQTLRLALEPEPCCYIETIAEAIRFFERHLLTRANLEVLGRLTGLNAPQAEVAMRRHCGVCLDLCHAAVEFEDAHECLRQLRAAAVEVPKVQISAGLRLPRVTAEDVEALRAFDDRIYLHQVVESVDGRLVRYLDLDQACAGFAPGPPSREWRIHFHVPIFLSAMEKFATTRGFIEEIMRIHRDTPISDHFEVETYTFDVLPPQHRGDDVVTHIVREVEWAAQQLRQ